MPFMPPNLKSIDKRFLVSTSGCVLANFKLACSFLSMKGSVFILSVHIP